MTTEGGNSDLMKKANAQPLSAGSGPDQESPAQTRARQAKVVLGPVAILWDMENCPVPSDVLSEDVAVNILMALRLHPAVLGAVTVFSAYGDFNMFPRKIREGCQRTGVNLIDVPNGRKDAADKAILVDMFLFVLDNPAPATILLISGDVDFSQALHKLGQRGYNIVLAVPSGQGVSSALSSAGRFVWDWPSLARGEGLVAAKVFVSRLEERSDVPITSACKSGVEDSCEETFYDGFAHQSVQTGPGTQDKTSRFAVRTAGTPLSVTDRGGRRGSLESGEPGYTSSPHTPASFCQGSSVPSSSTCKPAPTSCAASHPFPGFHQTDTGEPTSPGSVSNTSFVLPGDMEGLKKQLVKLLALHGGRLKFMRLPPEYFKLYGRPLYLSEYGEHKLADLLHKMEDVMRLTGHGVNRNLHLKEATQACRKHKGREHKGVVVQDSECEEELDGYEMHDRSHQPPPVVMQSRGNVLQDLSTNLPACSGGSPVAEKASLALGIIEPVLEPAEGGADDVSEEVAAVAAEYAADVNLQFFKVELQELLVSCGCSILMSCFQELYQQRYAKHLDFCAFGVQKLESLFEKLKDVVILEEVEISPGKVGKVLLARASHEKFFHLQH